MPPAPEPPDDAAPAAVVVAVHADEAHRFSKAARPSIRLVAGLGVEGDAHAGATVQHRARVARDPSQPNLRQVHLVAGELHDELRAAGYQVGPGDVGENVTTRGVDLLGLPTGSLLELGPGAVVAVTGLRSPCRQLDGVRPGLQGALLGRDPDGGIVRRAGVMAVVLRGGAVAPGDRVAVTRPTGAHHPLLPV